MSHMHSVELDPVNCNRRSSFGDASALVCVFA